MSAKQTNVSRIVFFACLGLLLGCSQPGEERPVDLTVPITVQPVETGTIEAVVTVTGTLRPLKEAELVTEVQGNLFWGKAEDGGILTRGDAVALGQLVARLENEEWVVQARLKSRRLELETARKVLREKELLLERGLVIELEVETARRDLSEAESNYLDAQIQIAKIRLQAPIAGVLAERSDATEGTRVVQGTVLGKIMDYSQVLVDLKIPNSQIQAVGRDKQVRVKNYAFGERVFNGHISVVDPALDPTTRTFRVVAAVDNAELLLRPGMFVKAEIVTEVSEDAVLVKRQFILLRQNQKVVFVEEGARAQMRPVETGLEDREYVEIVEGLDEGERLITSNYETLRSRTRVRVSGN
jgi:membrane fusion protein (multidrug efflux system)